MVDVDPGFERQYVRKNMRKFLGDGPVGKTIASSLIGSLVFLNATPAYVETEEGWWIISSDVDWLADLSLDPFNRIIPMPEAGSNQHRSEIIASSFACALVSICSTKRNWIIGSEADFSLSDTTLRRTIGRLVSVNWRVMMFKIDEQNWKGGG